MAYAQPIDRAISVQQPWAFAIAAGFKTIENRGVRCNYIGPVAIHAPLRRGDHAGWQDREAVEAYEAGGAGSTLWMAKSPMRPGGSAGQQDPRLARG